MGRNIGTKPLTDFRDAEIDRLYAAERYDEAADYYEQFHYDNAYDRDRAIAAINYCRAQARHKKAEYALLGEKASAVTFADGVFTQGSYDALRYQKNKAGENIYDSDEAFAKDYPEYAAFNTAYKHIGSSYIPNDKGGYDIADDAVSLKATIPFKKKGLLGDWAVKDTASYVDYVYNYIHSELGISKDDLQNNGVFVTELPNKDVEFIYDKNSKYGALLTVAFSSISENRGLFQDLTNNVIFEGYDKDGNKISRNDAAFIYHDANNLNKMRALVDDARATKQYVQSGTDEDYNRVFSSTTFNLPTLDVGENKKRLIEFSKSGGYDANAYEYYGLEDADSGDAMGVIDPEFYGDFMRNMNARRPDQIHFQGMVSGNKRGVLITLDPPLDSNGKPKGKRMKMFIAGYLPNLVNYEVQRSSDLMALTELNNMTSYGSAYEYTFKDGSRSHIDEQGRIHWYDKDGNHAIDDSPSARENLIRSLDRDFILQQADMQMSQYLNVDGTYNETSVNAAAMQIAVAAAEELYPNVPMTTTGGQNITAQDLFGEDKTFLQNMDANVNSMVRTKIEEVFNIYYSILNSTYHR